MGLTFTLVFVLNIAGMSIGCALPSVLKGRQDLVRLLAGEGQNNQLFLILACSNLAPHEKNGLGRLFAGDVQVQSFHR